MRESQKSKKSQKIREPELLVELLSVRDRARESKIVRESEKE